MKRSKKITALLLAVAMVATMLVGCGAKEAPAAESTDVAVDPVAKEFYLGKDFTL